jgi:hypothetical protein
MEGFTTRSLTQEKAILVARQGDPKFPAAGTLLARQRILNAELEAATQRYAKGEQAYLPASGTPYTHRHPELIRRDIRRIENELNKLQDRLREIDAQVAASGNKAAAQ